MTELLFSRSKGETVELRMEIDVDLMRAFDACCLADDLTRTGTVKKLITEHVKKQVHKATLIERMMRGNPLLSEFSRNGSESSRDDEDDQK